MAASAPTLIAALLVAISTFSAGFVGSVGYFRYFADSTPPPPYHPPGELLGESTDTATPSANDAPAGVSPTPNLTLDPPEIDKPFPGTLAYLQNNELYTIKADRTSPDQITADSQPKNQLVVSPNGLDLAYTIPGAKPDSQIVSVNRQTKKTAPIIDSGSDTFSELHYSPSGRYLSAWVNHGSAVLVIDTQTSKVTLRFTSSDEKKGISPIAWIPGTDNVSFILDGELFTGNSQGKDLKSLAINAAALKIGPQNADLPLTPVWSPLGNNLAFVRANGLNILNLETRLETPVAAAENPYELDKIPYRAIAFTPTGSHLIYEAEANDEKITTFAYSLNEKKVVPLTAYASTSILNGPANTLLGLLYHGSNQSQLGRYSLNTWKEELCPQSPLDYPVPPAGELLNTSGTALVNLTKEQDIFALKLINLETCDAYDLVKAPGLANPLWLPN